MGGTRGRADALGSIAHLPQPASPVMAAAIIARHGINTLVLVHRTELLKQWQARLQAFLALDEEARHFVVGTIGGGKAKPTAKVDIAVMQSLSRQGEVNALVEDYRQVQGAGADRAHGAPRRHPFRPGSPGATAIRTARSEVKEAACRPHSRT